MNALRKTRLVVLFAVLALVLVGVAATSAEAGCHKTYYGGHGHYNNFHVAHYTPIVHHIPQPYTYPVVLYDYLGQPYTIWKTAYTTVPVQYFP